MPNKLSDLQIDEISLVYKGANQHSRVAIAKSFDGQQEDTVEIYDQDGNLVDPDTLEEGDIVFDGEGQAYQFAEELDEGLDEDLTYEDELEPVGKSEIFKAGAAGVARAGGRAAGKAARAHRAAYGAPAARAGRAVSAVTGGARKGASAAAGGARRGAAATTGAGRKAAGSVAGAARSAAGSVRSGASSARTYASETAGPSVARFARRNRALIGGLGGGAVGGAGGAAAINGINNRRVQKSFGDEMRTELSKALSDDDRDEVIAKAFDYVEYLEEVAKSAEEIAETEREARRYNEYLEIAKSYLLPVSDEELAEVMMAIEDNLDPEYVEVIAKCLGVASDAIYDEIGAEGGGMTYSPVMDSIEQYANTNVAKSDTSNAEVVSKAFESDPTLYDRYLSETGYYNR